MGVFETPLSQLDLPELQVVQGSLSVKEVLNIFFKQSIGVLGISDDSGKVANIFFETDLILHLSPEEMNQWGEIPVSKISDCKVFSIDINGYISDALELMAKIKFRFLPIKKKENNYLVLSARNILDLLVEHYRPLCEKYGVLTEWEEQIGNIDEESSQFCSQKNALETGSFLLARMHEIIGSDVFKIKEDVTVGELWQKMRATGLTVAIIVKWTTMVEGIVTEKDLIYRTFADGEKIMDWPVKKIMTAKPRSLLCKHYIIYALNNMVTFNYRKMLVVDEDGMPIKTTELIDFLKYFHRVIKAQSPSIVAVPNE